MKKAIFLLTVLLLSFFCPLYPVPCPLAYAAVPHLLNYQGRLTDSGGKPLEGMHTLTFRIYDAETAGNLLWEETQSGVVIQKGIFSILLGSVTNLNLAFDKPYFLEIKVGNEVMSPRQAITSAGYAIRAETAEKAKVQADSADAAPGYLSDKVDNTTIRVNVNDKIEIPYSTAQAVAASDIDAPTSEEIMNGMSISITTKGTKLLCLFTAPVRTGGGPSYLFAKLYIDDIEKVKSHAGTSSGTTQIDSANLCFNWLETGLTPGNHTVKIKWWRTQQGYYVQQRGSTDGQRVLTVIDLP